MLKLSFSAPHVTSWNNNVGPMCRHSRSFILQSATGRQGVTYRHIIFAGLISQVSEEVASQIAKIVVVNNPTLIWKPRQEEPPRVSACTLYFEKLESLAYIFVADSLGLSSFKFIVQWAPKHASFLHQRAFWPFKVIQGRWFWYQSKACMRPPISQSLWLWSYLALLR